MKRLKILILSLLALTMFSCSDPSYVSIVDTCILDSSWNTTKIVTHYEHSNEGAATGGVVGATGGWLLIGGPIAIIGGAIVGATIGSNPTAQSWTENELVPHSIYTIKLIDGTIFKSTQAFPSGTKIDTRYNNFYQNY